MGDITKSFSIRFGAQRDSICGASQASRARPLTPSAPTYVRASHAATLTHRHPLILEEVFPFYAIALDNLPEEPTPVTLPFFTRHLTPEDGMEAEGPGDDMASSLAVEVSGVPPPAVVPASTGPEVIPVALAPLPGTEAINPDADTAPAEVQRQAAIPTFTSVPLLKGTNTLPMVDIVLLLHLLHDT